MALSFSLGLGLGMSQPMVMSLLHSHAPPGRMGEAAGVRMSLVQSMSVAVPLAFGALGATIGLTPVFWSVGVCLATGGWLSERAVSGGLTPSAAPRTTCGTWRPWARPRTCSRAGRVALEVVLVITLRRIERRRVRRSR